MPNILKRLKERKHEEERKRLEEIAEQDGVPSGTFRCDVCQFIQPVILMGGVVLDDSSEESYTLCCVCLQWLGFEEFKLPAGWAICSEKQREKIKVLRKEMEIKNKKLMPLTKLPPSNSSLDKIHEFLEQIPHLDELVHLRDLILPDEIRELSSRLTNGEFVDPSEISSHNEKITLMDGLYTIERK